jgi:hypothetical protein
MVATWGPMRFRGAAIRAARIRCSMLGLLVIAMGCASAPVPRGDTVGSVAWRATAFQRVPMTVHDRPGERYTFTLLLREQAGTGITFTRVTQTVSAAAVRPMTVTQEGQWRLPPQGELQLPFRLVWSCPALSEACSTAAGPPHWHILLAGTTDRGEPMQLSLEIDAPAGDAVVASR